MTAPNTSGELPLPTAPAIPFADQTGGSSLRILRETIARSVVRGEIRPNEAPRRYSDAADAWIQALFSHATKGKTKGLSLVAVGGYGRRELCPWSDLDLVLFHRFRRDHDEIAKQIWYAIWNDGLKLDHSVRTRSQAMTMARQDMKVVLGLQDGRVIAGDTKLASGILTKAQAIWRNQQPPFLDELRESARSRQRQFGELAFMLEPDLKQAAGGLRDSAVLRALALANPDIGDLISSRNLESFERFLLSARVALQARTETSSDRLLLQEQEEVAHMLELANADQLMAQIAEAGRAISATCTEAWRKTKPVTTVNQQSPVSSNDPLPVGLEFRNGEISLCNDANLTSDPWLVIRIAKAAAGRDALIETASLEQLANTGGDLPSPWPFDVRADFFDFCSAGAPFISVAEALDQHRLFERILPEWSHVRNRPQRNAYHRYTVDRHLLEAIAMTKPLLSTVSRPDLLLAGALLHDIGKGYDGDHSQIGEQIARSVATRMGFSSHDIEIIAKLVAYHLVLPEIATRRDLGDPSTANVVARLVGDEPTLELLAALAIADGLATGSSAWGPWKADLVEHLRDKVSVVLRGGVPAPVPDFDLPADSAATPGIEVTPGKLTLKVSGHTLTVAAPDRPGLLAMVAGTLALNGCNVRRAKASTLYQGMAIEVFDLEPAFSREPDWADVKQDLAAVLADNCDLSAALADQDRTYATYRRPQSATPPTISVTVDNITSDRSSIIEVRAPDSFGLLHQLATRLASADLDVVAALVDTLGYEVIDTFYVREHNGVKISDQARIEQVRSQLEQVARENYKLVGGEENSDSAAGDKTP